MSQSQCSGGSQGGHNDQNKAAAYMHSNPFRVDENVACVMPLNPNWMVTRQQQQAQYYPYFPYVPQRAHFPSVSTNIALSVSTSLDVAAHENSSCSNSAPSTSANNTNSDPNNGAKTFNKWSKAQTSILVNEWKERINELESAQATETWRTTETWHRIVRAVCDVGTPRTAKQCKDEIRNLKSAYKTAKTNNNKTGRPRQTSPYYDSFDKVLGTRAVVTMPAVLQSGKPSEESSSSGQMNDSNESDEESDDGLLPGESDSESLPSSAERRPKRKIKKTKEEQKKKAKKGRVTTASAMVDLTEKLVGMQNSQMEMMEKAQKRAEDLLVKLEADQRKLDEEGRRRDQEFFLRMMEIMKKYTVY